MNCKTFVGVLTVFFLSASVADAASLYMDPRTSEIERGDTIKVSVRLDTDQGECVNVVDGVIAYSDNIQLVDVSRGQSIMSMWVEPPKIDNKNHTMTFAGGIPNGYCGRIAGDPRLTNVVVDLIFQSPGFVIGASDVATATISFDEQSQVLLNDGFGTRAPLSTYGAELVLAKNKSGQINNQWNEVVVNDTLPPEDFSILLDRTANAYNNRYFITFNTTDKQSGIDHYEVIEEPLSESLFSWGREDAPWVTTDSPYRLKDQSLNSRIRVRAIDKAGNQYVATLVPSKDQRSMTTEVKILIAIIAAVLLAFLFSGILYAVLRRRKKNVSLHSEIAASDVSDESGKEEET